MAAAQQLRWGGGAARLRLRQKLRVEAGEGAHPVGGVEIHHQHVHRAIGAGLQLEAAFHLQGGAEQHGQSRSLPQQPGDRRGIAMAGQNGVHGGAEPHHAATHIQRLDREGDRHIVQTEIGNRTRRGGHHAGRAPMHQAITPFCAWRRFSASSKTTDCGPSMTSSVTSSPRWAGRQCMKMASLAAAAMRRALT